MLFSTA